MMMRVKLAAIWSGLVLLGLLTLLWLVLIARGGGLEWDFGIGILIAWWMTMVFATAATVFAAGRLRVVMATAMFGAFAIIVMMLFGWDNGPGWFLWALWFWSAAMAQAGLIVLASPLRSPGTRILRVVTFVALGTMCGTIYLRVDDMISLTAPYEDWLQQAAAMACVVNAAGTVALYLLCALEHLKRPAPQSIPADVALEATCPRCTTRCTFHHGKSHCPSCGLRVTLEIEEPRCACGYLLYKLDSEQCPECGRGVPRPAIARVHA